ncbi:hypothetical protein [Streptomyces sp. NBC_01431]|uniref:hypothetical protein n=1 Tax=Streptomyces sp. NBC_01431 TaxID=2903863 RepID=UPI002E378988|nr:hypothetical protein [Streptomyces sp. NBC_01431]
MIGRPLPAARGFAVPDRSDIRLHTLADVFAYSEAEGIRLQIDGVETQGLHTLAAGIDRDRAAVIADLALP